MGPFAFFRNAVQRWLLRNALALEEEVLAHFEDLPEELAGLELPPALAAIVAEEREHRRLLRELIDGRLPEAELEKALAVPRVHPEHQVAPLGTECAPLREKLRHIAEHERAIYEFFRGLHRKSRIPFVKQVFRFLAAQEEAHVSLLERLLG